MGQQRLSMNNDIQTSAGGRDDDDAGGPTGLGEAMRLYGRVLGALLAAIGLCSLIALKAGWLGLIWPSEIPLDANELEAGDRTDRATIEVKGPKTLFSRGMTVVDTSRIYRLDADVRVLPGEDGGLKTPWSISG